MHRPRTSQAFFAPRALLAAALWLAAASGAHAAETHGAAIRYTLQPGDNPWQLARDHLQCMCLLEPLLALNRIGSPQRLRPGMVLKVPVDWLKQSPAVARVAHVSGAVQWQVGTGPVQALQSGDRLPMASVIETAGDGQATLILPNGSRATVQPDSRVRIVQSERTPLSTAMRWRLDIDHGSVEHSVEREVPGGQFKVNTPQGVATVRGTDFRVAADAHHMRAEVLQGAVQVAGTSGAGSLTLPRGTGVLVPSGGGPGTLQTLLPAPDVALLPTLVERFPHVIALPPSADTRAYRTQWYLQGDAQQVITEPPSTVPTLIGQHVPDGVHTLRIRRVHANGLEGLPAQVQVRVDRRPEPPIYLSPAPGAVLAQARPSMRWTTSEWARVQLQLSPTPGFEAPLVDATLDNTGSFALQHDLAVGTWHWRMASLDAQGRAGPWGEVQTLTRQAEPPALQEPQADGDRVVLRWRPVPAAQGYEISLQALPAQADPVLLESPEAAQWVLPADQPPGDYAMRVRARMPGGLAGAWSAPQRFTIAPQRPWWPWLMLLLPLLAL